MSDELASILSPPAKRKRGRQKGSRSPALAARREALRLTYMSEKAASPNASDEKIAEVLHRRGEFLGRFIVYPSKDDALFVDVLLRCRATDAAPRVVWRLIRRHLGYFDDCIAAICTIRRRTYR
jgi:hypothetical protein